MVAEAAVVEVEVGQATMVAVGVLHPMVGANLPRHMTRDLEAATTKDHLMTIQTLAQDFGLVLASEVLLVICLEVEGIRTMAVTDIHIVDGIITAMEIMDITTSLRQVPLFLVPQVLTVQVATRTNREAMEVLLVDNVFAKYSLAGTL